MGRQKSASLRDVAKIAEVSTATVSRVINDTGRVSQKVRARVEAAIAQIGWVPNASAIALATNRTRTVGAIIPTLDHQNFARIVQSLQARLLEARYNLLISCTNYEPDATARQARTMVERGVEALVLVGGDHPKELFDLLAQQGVPHVLVYATPGTVPGHAVVGFDNAAATRKGTSYLLELGHRSFGLIAQTSAFNDRARARQQGVRSTLEDHGYAVRPVHFVEGNWKIEDGIHAFQKIMSTDSPPTAIVCTNDYVALGCIIAAQQMGISIPDDVSVIGFDDIELAHLMAPGLTTMRVPDLEVGSRSARYIIDLLNGRQPGPTEVPLPELIIRGSTAAPRSKS